MNTNFRQYNIFFFTCILAFFSGCNDELEINPEDNLTGDVVFSSEFAIRGAVTGLYGQALEGDALNGNRYAYTGIQSDELSFVGSFPTLINVFNYDTQAVNGSTAALWSEGYEIINNANFIITKIPDINIQDFTEEEKGQAIAEAKFMRAMMYFELSRIYGQPFQFDNGNSLGVPISTIPFDDTATPDQFNIARSSLNEVHGFIKNDLEDAIQGLAESSDNTRASKGAAQALLARLHLYREEWNEAADLANEVINSGEYALAQDYTFYKSLSNENIFVLANNSNNNATNTGNGASLINFANPTPLPGRGDMYYSDFLVSSFESGDIAASNSEGRDLRLVQASRVGNNAIEEERIFQDKVAPSGLNPLPVIRIAEMYLIRAEANLRGGTSIGDTPVNDINRIKERAGLETIATITLDDILEERLKEFAVEGHRRMDLLRNRRALRQPGDAQFTVSQFGADKTIFPIPAAQVNITPLLEQNTGY
ncbi:RagB/SusD family nutrient uptake outer membrane protein [Aquimarina hainanensis]|uniref:RagB/SusD family nutrient uptake outer membrane protein n=1 Tax=Aquimarina hainanensis TaxID=1578017 RepID=A0ABW5NBP5_9FLAO